MVKKVQPRSALHHGSSEPQERRTKIGLILECGPEGPDQKVCEYLVERLRPDTEVVSVTLINKERLIPQCGQAAAILLNQGCERVIIVWDLYPAWGIRRGAKPCFKNDRDGIFNSLDAAGVVLSAVHLVCIHKMLEAWVLADERAIAEVISKMTKKDIRVPKAKRPESEVKPKKLLAKIFSEYGHDYQSHIHAEMIVKEIRDFNRLKRCKSFAYFHLQVTDKELKP